MGFIDRRDTTRGVRYEARYRDPDGKERSRTFRTRKEAERFVSLTTAALTRNEWVDPRAGQRTFAVVAVEWLDSNPTKRGSTYARDETIIRVHLVPALGQRPLGSIVPADVSRLVKQWSEHLAHRTVRRNFGTLRAILNYAVANDYIARSPARNITLSRPQQLERPIIDSDAVLRLVNAIGRDHAPVVLLGAVLGLRWGECAGLRVRSIDFLGGAITVDEQITRGIAGRAEVGPPKSDAGKRTMAVPPPLMELLSAHLARRGLTAADHDALVFSDRAGGPMSYSNFRERHWNPACVAARVGEWKEERTNSRNRRRYAGLTFHDLRRLNATALVAEGVDIKTTQRRLGHSDIRTTLEVYARATTKADRDAAAALGTRFFGAPQRSRNPARRDPHPQLPGMEIG